jgi:hypothetical protein
MDILLDFLNDNWMVILGGAAGGGIGLLVSWRELGKIFRMLRTSTGDIASPPGDEYVEVVGRAESRNPIPSPITQTPCVLWQVLVSERRSTGRSSRWVVVRNVTSPESFEVSDGTGRVQVHPIRGVELLLRDDVKKSSGLFRALDEQTQAALTKMGVDTKGLLNMNKSMRVQERFIEPGDQVYVLGKTYTSGGQRMLDGESAPLMISDRSELSLLSRFAGQVFINSLGGVVIGAMLAFYFTSR